MDEAPAVSVIMPVYNGAKTVRASIETLFKQTFPHWEVLVIDDGSTDGTPGILRQIVGEDRRVRLLAQANQRQAAARNAGLAQARGRYIALLDADDYALPERLAKQVAFLDQNPAVTVLGGGRIEVDGAGRELRVFLHPETHEDLCKKIFTQCPFCTSTVMTRRQFFATRRFDVTMPPCEDHDLWLRSYRDPVVRFHNLPEPLVRYTARRRVRWHHFRQMSRMYRRALRAEGRWPAGSWYALRPLIAAVRFNPLNRGD